MQHAASCNGPSKPKCYHGVSRVVGRVRTQMSARNICIEKNVVFRKMLCNTLRREKGGGRGGDQRVTLLSGGLV